ncbi:uncharacterized protein [Temnothorax nylanderi]|uniref:uncharacterized protein isoform X2 n=1 Tax=Temnothorax nylanderi TaxID=102681 RepID=UPI003A881A73
MSSAEKKNSNNCCCVVGCKNTRKNTKNVRFYSFPNRPWEIERKKKWITVVRRLTKDGKPWMPTKNSTICSTHFVGGAKSDNPGNEAFCPTIFPPIYRKKTLVNSDRAKRLEARRKNVEALYDIDVSNHCHSVPSITVETNEIGIQTDASYVVEEDDVPSIIFCSIDSVLHEAEIQTNIQILKKKTKKGIIVPQSLLVEKKDARIGPDNEWKEGFKGFENIKDDSTMKQLGSISLSLYLILMQFIRPKAIGQPSFYRSLSAKNRLLLFLMKMKLGISFSALGCIFNISKVTASSIFYSTLNTLYEKTKTWLFWPSREAIKKTMPQSFVNYPNCRAIIDCTELKCDTPPTVEQRALMYSSYKSCFTVKYLIAISPSGLITFVSKGYGGRSSDSFITNDCGFLNLIEPGDLVLADKDFPAIRTEILKRKCTLVMPPFGYNPQFTSEEVLEGYNIASVRIHVERAIQRIKLFQILHHINIECLPYIDKIVYVACVLANNKEPLILRGEEEST